MGNRVISYSLREIEVFLKVPVIIIIRFGENNVLGTIYIDIYQFLEWAEEEHGPPHIFLFIIHKNGKIIRACMTYIKITFYIFFIFIFIFFYDE